MLMVDSKYGMKLRPKVRKQHSYGRRGMAVDVDQSVGATDLRHPPGGQKQPKSHETARDSNGVTAVAAALRRLFLMIQYSLHKEQHKSENEDHDDESPRLRSVIGRGCHVS